MILKQRGSTDLQEFAPSLCTCPVPSLNNDIPVVLHNETIFYVNGIVLANSSSIFTDTISKSRQLVLDGILSGSKDDILICFRWLYGCECDVSSLECALTIYNFGSYFVVRELCHVVEEWIMEDAHDFTVWEIMYAFKSVDSKLSSVFKRTLDRNLRKNPGEVFEGCTAAIESRDTTPEKRGYIFTQILRLFDIIHTKRFLHPDNNAKPSELTLEIPLSAITAAFNTVVAAATRALSEEIGAFFTPSNRPTKTNETMATILNHLQNKAIAYASPKDPTIVFVLSSDEVHRLTTTSNMTHILGFCDWTPVPQYVKLEIGIKWISHHTESSQPVYHDILQSVREMGPKYGEAINKKLKQLIDKDVKQLGLALHDNIKHRECVWLLYKSEESSSAVFMTRPVVEDFKTGVELGEHVCEVHGAGECKYFLKYDPGQVLNYDTSLSPHWIITHSDNEGKEGLFSLVTDPESELVDLLEKSVEIRAIVLSEAK